MPALSRATRSSKSGELQRLLGKKTMENEILKEAVDVMKSRKWLQIVSSRGLGGQRVILICRTSLLADRYIGGCLLTLASYPRCRSKVGPAWREALLPRGTAGSLVALARLLWGASLAGRK